MGQMQEFKIQRNYNFSLRKETWSLITYNKKKKYNILTFRILRELT